MPFAVGVSHQPAAAAALTECAAQVRAGLGDGTPDLTFLFVSHHYEEEFARLPAQLQAALPSRHLLGCTGEAVIAGGKEFESGPTLCVWSAVLPGAEITPWQIAFRKTADGVVCDGLLSGDETAVPPQAIFALADPFSSMPKALIECFEGEYPEVPLIGGMASGGGPGQNMLFQNDRCVEEGAVGILLRGGPKLRTIVSQGCKPIGTPWIVTKSDKNIVQSLGGVAPLRRLEEIFQALSARDQELAELGLFLGIAMNEYQDQFHRGDFLIANVLGADQRTGAVAIGNSVRAGQTVQFHLRDAAAADEDLVQLLERDKASHRPPAGALLFSCNGRGTRMFPELHHDAGAIQRLLGEMPLAGFFAQGELGPVGGHNYIHGFTASLALFDEA